jgi:hypothetical protein
MVRRLRLPNPPNLPHNHRRSSPVYRYFLTESLPPTRMEIPRYPPRSSNDYGVVHLQFAGLGFNPWSDIPGKSGHWCLCYADGSRPGQLGM